MGYSVWDRVKGGPALSTRYQRKSTAQIVCDRLNAAAAVTDGETRYYIKPL